MSTSLKYYDSLTDLRGIAALLVMTMHFFNQLDINMPLLSVFYELSKIGQTGVTLFFVLSGFLITRILINSKEQSSYFKNFYIRRTLRIFPLYYLFLVLYYYLFPLILEAPVSFESKPFYFLYLQNFAITFQWLANDGPGHFWSLAVEEHFYLIWPFIVFTCPKRALKKLIYIIIFAALIARFYLSYSGHEIMWLTYARMDSLAIGGLLAIYEFDNKINSYSRNFIYVILSCIILIFLTSFIFKRQEWRNIFHILKYTFWSFGFLGFMGYILSINRKIL